MLMGTMAIWGLNLSVVKWLLTSQPAVAVASLRMVVGAVFLTLTLRVWLRRPWPALNRRQWAWILACAVMLVYVNQICFVYGVRGTTAANAALIVALNPLLSSLLAVVCFGERLTAARIAGIGLGFGGVATVVAHQPGHVMGLPGLGDLVVLASVMSWAAGGAMVQRMAGRIDTVSISWAVYNIGALMLLVHLCLWPAPLDWPALTPLAVLALLLSGLLSTGASALVWNRALLTLGVARTALYAYWVPIFGVLFAVLLLGEPVTVWHGVGLVAVLSGTWLGTRRA